MRYTLTICALFLLSAVLALGQGQHFEKRFKVTFPNPVVVNKDLTLQPGTYTFQQVKSPARPDAFYVSDMSGKRMGFTSVASETQPKARIEPETAARQTKVLLKQIDGKYYLDRAWISGENRGYQFMLPSDVQKQVKDEVADKNNPDAGDTVIVATPYNDNSNESPNSVGGNTGNSQPQ